MEAAAAAAAARALSLPPPPSVSRTDRPAAAAKVVRSPGYRSLPPLSLSRRVAAAAASSSVLPSRCRCIGPTNSIAGRQGGLAVASSESAAAAGLADNALPHATRPSASVCPCAGRAGVLYCRTVHSLW